MISNLAKIKVFIGSFFIQASWSFKKMQGLGFASAISPALGEIYTDRPHRLEALKRHTVYYNAHPYMASPILGAVINIEEHVSKLDAEPGAVVSFKEALMGPYGSIGDGFFWGSLRPVTALLGIGAAFFIGLWGPLLFIVLYNLIHIHLRWKGLGLGLKYGVGVIDRISALNLPVWSIRLRYLGSVLLGVVSTVLVLALFGELSITGDGGALMSIPSIDVSSSTLFLVELAVIVLALFVNVFLVGRLALQRLVYAVIVPALIFGIIIL